MFRAELPRRLISTAADLAGEVRGFASSLRDRSHGPGSVWDRVHSVRDRVRWARDKVEDGLQRARKALARRLGRSEPEVPVLHLVSYDANWALRREGERRSSEVFGSREGALARARELARQQRCVLVVHRRNGEIEAQLDCTPAQEPPPF